MIPPRLLPLLSYVKSDDVVIDVGADHGFLAIELAKNNIAKRVLASDNKRGPFRRLQNNINQAGYQATIDVLLQDGIEYLPADVNTVIIAGMGGATIIEILTNGRTQLSNVEKLILLPHNQEKDVRHLLTTIGFVITGEQVIADNGKYYELIVAERGKTTYNDDQLLFGPLNLINKQATFIEKWQMIYQDNARLLSLQLSPVRRKQLERLQTRLEQLW